MSRDLIESGLGWQYSSRAHRGLMNDPETAALVAATAIESPCSPS